MKGFIRKFGYFFFRDLKSILVSVIFAFILWVVINFNIYPIVTERFNTIPLQAEPTIFMKDSDLQIISEIETAVSVQVEGKRLIVNSLKQEDFTARLDLTTVYGRGKFQARVIVEPIDPDIEIDFIALSPEYVEIEVEKYISKEFDITPETTSLKIAEGFKLGTAQAVPQKIILVGPSDAINSIGVVKAKPIYDNLLSETLDIKSEILLYNHTGNRIENEDIKIPSENVTVHIPVYKQKSLPVTVTFKGVPSGFDIETLKYSIEPKMLEISSPDDSIDNLSEINIGVVHLNEINLSETYSLPITLPDGYENLSGDTMAIIRFENNNYGRLNFNIKKTNITVMNIPNNFDVSLVTNIIENVTVIGPSNTISSLSPDGDDLTATVNLLGTTLTEGVQEINASISLKNGARTCWVAGGPYKITINVKKKE